ncbi:Polyketide synthesis cyclase protein [Dioscorea alata]|uniref:Polyketide synthesis cyclase protein n=1 Tax=Dioscorea alata TaxID=55571 RepID=A0ACB7WW75_DIOAL|nr:Polyketide synthesis cyclase protein [Dioscorea alata]
MTRSSTMHDLSPVDGFMDVKEGVDEMIKYLANEPSVGLFFVQQHAQTSMPYLLGVKDKVMEKMHEVALHTEDIEDSIHVVNSMSECGLSIANDMVQDINRSLLIMSTSQPKRGLIQNPLSGFYTDRSSSNWATDSDAHAGSNQDDSKSGRNYISTFFNSAKQKVAGVKWSPPNNKGPFESVKFEPHADSNTSNKITTSATDCGTNQNLVNVDVEELPLSSNFVNDKHEEQESCSRYLRDDDGAPAALDTFDKFKSDQEAKLEKWLQET